MDVALEDFGIRRRRRTSNAEQPPVEAPRTVATAPPVVEIASGPTCGVAWSGRARRRPELQRFCDHLDSLRERVP